MYSPCVFAGRTSSCFPHSLQNLAVFSKTLCWQCGHFIFRLQWSLQRNKQLVCKSGKVNGAFWKLLECTLKTPTIKQIPFTFNLVSWGPVRLWLRILLSTLQNNHQTKAFSFVWTLIIQQRPTNTSWVVLSGH